MASALQMVFVMANRHFQNTCALLVDDFEAPPFFAKALVVSSVHPPFPLPFFMIPPFDL